MALKAEAEPLIKFFSLKNITEQTPFKKLYANINEQIFLVVSGIGVTNIKKVVFDLNKYHNTNKNCLWVNIGIAGQTSLKIGSIYEIKKIISKKKDNVYFTNSFVNCFKTKVICCVDKEEKEYSDDYLYDMESYGFMEALDLLTTRDNIFMFKIISDNLLYKPKNYKDFASQNIEKYIKSIYKLLYNYRIITNKYIDDFDNILNLVKNKYHVTFYNEKKLEKIILKISSFRNEDLIKDDILNSNSLKGLLDKYEKFLNNYLLKI